MRKHSRRLKIGTIGCSGGTSCEPNICRKAREGRLERSRADPSLRLCFLPQKGQSRVQCEEVSMITFIWLILTFGDHLCGTKHPLTEQSEARSPIELAFDRLEAVDLTLGLAVTPRAGEGRLHCGAITAESGGEAGQFWQAALFDGGEPPFEGRRVAGMHKGQELVGAGVGGGQFG